MRTFVGAVIVVLALLIGASFYFNWISISRTDVVAQDGSAVKKGVTVTVDAEKAKDDMKHAGDVVKQTASDASHKVGEAAESAAEKTKQAAMDAGHRINETFHNAEDKARGMAADASDRLHVKHAAGAVDKFDADTREITVLLEKGDKLVVVLDEKAVVDRDGKTVESKTLKVGDKIKVDYQDRAGRNVANRAWVVR